MIITKDQKLNLGALFALREIIENSQTKIARHLQPEHRDHILAVLANIISKPQIHLLLEKQVTVHPNLEDMIRLDLKLSKEDKIDSVCVIWASLIALLFDVRQDEAPNCFAVSSLIYATENATYKVLSKMLDWLTTGHFACSSSITIPILPLVEKRLIYERDLQVALEASETLSLTTFEKICEVLGLECEDHMQIFAGTLTLHQTLKKLIDMNHAESNLLFAEKLFYTFTHNTIVTMMLAMIEFQDVNITRKTAPLPPYSVEKENFINCLMEPLEKKLGTDICQKMREKLGQKIWLENCSEKHVQRSGRNLTIGPSHSQQTIKDFRGNVDELVNTVKKGRRIFFLEQGTYGVIETFSQLKKALKIIAGEVANELKLNNNTRAAILSHFYKKSYTDQVADFCAFQINKRGISGQDLLHSNLLIQADLGGAISSVEQLFQINFDKRIDWRAKSAHQFLKLFYMHLKTIDSSILSTAPIFLVGTPSHAFTLDPKRCSQIWKDQTDFASLSKRTLFEPASQFLKKGISSSLITSIIDIYADRDNTLQKNLHAIFDAKKGLTYDSFRMQLLSYVSKAQSRKRLQEIIDQEYAKVFLCASEFPALFKKLNLQISLEALISIQNTLRQKHNTRTYPYQLAHTLRKILILHGFPIIDPSQIEQAICEIKALPLAFDIGDINYYDREREDPFHIRAVIRYHFGYKTLCYFFRYKDREIVDDKKEYATCEIFYP
jgi:hypothetical protein